jgi:hypothetical protein
MVGQAVVVYHVQACDGSTAANQCHLSLLGAGLKNHSQQQVQLQEGQTWGGHEVDSMQLVPQQLP